MVETSSRLKSEKGLLRRDLLRGASVGIAASLGASLLPSVSHGQRPGPSAASPAPARTAPTPTPESLPQGFSRDEYLRRWQKVRERMKATGFDCLIVPPRPENNVDVRYLTGAGGGWAVFPYDGKVTLIGGRGGGGGGRSDLGTESRSAENGLWSPAIIDALREKGMSQARIGVGYLADVWRNEEGGVNYTTLDRIRKAFPQAKFESAVDLLMRAQLVKSAEEIAVLEKANDVGEAGLQTMMDTARPGVLLRNVQMRMYQTMAGASGEEPIIAFDVEGSRVTEPREEVLRPGQILNQEITGRVLGYGTQVNHAVCIGSPPPAEWVPAAQYCLEVLHNLLEWIKPGKSAKEFNEFYNQKMQAKGITDTAISVIIHDSGGGYGPRIGPGRKEGLDLVFEPGWVFSIKPRTPMPQARADVRIGDGVVLTGQGLRRLGKRKLEVITLGA